MLLHQGQSDEEQIQNPQEDYIKAVTDVIDEISFSFTFPTCLITPFAKQSFILRQKIKLLKKFNLSYHPQVFRNINQRE